MYCVENTSASSIAESSATSAALKLPSAKFAVSVWAISSSRPPARTFGSSRDCPAASATCSTSPCVTSSAFSTLKPSFVVDQGEVRRPEKNARFFRKRNTAKLQTEYPGQFVAKMGAEAIKELLRRVEVDKLADELREKMKADPSLQKRIKFCQAPQRFSKRSARAATSLSG